MSQISLDNIWETNRIKIYGLEEHLTHSASFFYSWETENGPRSTSTFAIEFYNTTRGTWPWLAYGNDRGEGGSQDASMLDPRKAARPGIITARVKVPLRRYSWRNAFHFFFSARLVHARSPGNVKRLNQSSELACVPKKKLSLFLSLSLSRLLAYEA